LGGGWEELEHAMGFSFFNGIQRVRVWLVAENSV
tara:strand:+ start:65 stop:166 length:102 start_codon:yes stop_codon:yes gene_type:complete